ncbi:hypothetical protein Ancab_032246 [Ancistrocladus abbreviatus]
MDTRLKLRLFLFAVLLIFVSEAGKSIDPYKVLGVDRNASQREIQKAFHKLSLQYHPDKNKNKGAQEKFAEINNAYEILSDEEKRKNYDLYGDDRSGPSFDTGNAGGYGGYTFTNGGAGQSRSHFRPDEWQSMGGQGKSHSFSFSFGGPGGGNSFGFGLDDIFSNFFGGINMNGGFNFGGFGGSSGSRFGGSHSSSSSQSGHKSSPKKTQAVNSEVFEKEISDKGITWLLVSYTPSVKLNQQQESILEEIANSLKGALKVGKTNCESDPSFCKNHGINPRRAPRLFVYSYISSDAGSFVEYSGERDLNSLKSFCQDHLPRFSKRVNLDKFEPSFGDGERRPRVMLLSTKKDTPVIWRALSGLYRKCFTFYDAQVLDVTDPNVKKLGVDALPAIVGWLSIGEKEIIKTGISVKDLESAVQDLSLLLDGFEKKNAKVAPNKAKKPETESPDRHIPLLTASNFNAICGETTPVCIIGAFRSSKAREKLESILSTLSQKSISRTRNFSSGTKDSVSYALLDMNKQQAFLNAFDKSGFKSSDKFLLAYKPKKGKYATLVDEVTADEAEKFISSVLSGDIQFIKMRQKPMIK